MRPLLTQILAAIVFNCVNTAEALSFVTPIRDLSSADLHQIFADPADVTNHRSAQATADTPRNAAAQAGIQYRLTFAASDGPSDDTIIELTKSAIRKDGLAAIAQEYGNLDELGPNVLSQIQALAPATARPIMNCHLNAPPQRIACINRVKSELVAERNAKRANVLNTDPGTMFVISVRQKDNYEGNCVAFVNIRKRGTDQTWQWKLLIKPKNGSWVISEKSEKEIK